MSRIAAELDRLDRALDRLEAAVAGREQSHAEALDAARTARQAETAAVAERVEEAIHRLETVLDS